MPYNGAGTFTSLGVPTFPAVTGDYILASYFNATMNDVFLGLSTALPRDGQAAMSANLPMGAFKITGLGNGSNPQDATTFLQVFTSPTFSNATLTGVVTVTGATSMLVPSPAAADDSQKAVPTSYLVDYYAPLASPTFTGVPAVPTAAPGTNTTQVASTAFVQAQAFVAALPVQTGNSGKLVTTDGATASWTAVKTINSVSIVGSGNVNSGTVVLASATPTASANVDFLTTFAAGYDNYDIFVEGVLPASGTPNLYLRVAVAGTADTSSSYYTGAIEASSGFTTAAAFHLICNNIFSAGKGCGASIRISNTNDATNMKLVESRAGCQTDAVPTFFTVAKTTIYNAANALTGFRLYWSGGQDFAVTGKVRVVAYNNSAT